MKKGFLFVVLLLAVMLLTSCAEALAEGDVPPPDQISDNPYFSVYEWNRTIVPYASDEVSLIYVVASITKQSSNSVYIRGVTQANKQCVIVGGTMCVQQWKNNQWNNYSVTSYIEYSAFSATGEKVVTVEPGYYYRLVIQHRALDAQSDYSTIATNSILVN